MVIQFLNTCHFFDIHVYQRHCKEGYIFSEFFSGNLREMVSFRTFSLKVCIFHMILSKNCCKICSHSKTGNFFSIMSLLVRFSLKKELLGKFVLFSPKKDNCLQRMTSWLVLMFFNVS